MVQTKKILEESKSLQFDNGITFFGRGGRMMAGILLVVV